MSSDLVTAIVRILDAKGVTVGTGFMLSTDGLLTTCAHVVEAAGGKPGAEVRLIFQTTGNEAVATVEPDGWCDSNAEDIAILRLAGSPPEGVRPVSLGSGIGTNDVPFRAFGFPRLGELQGVWADGKILGTITDGQDIVMLQLRSQEIEAGMSGAPLLDIRNNLVVGMINATYYPPDGSAKFEHAAFAIPANILQKVCPVIPLVQPLDPLEIKLDQYRKRVLTETKCISLRGIPRPAQLEGVELPLERVYIRVQAVDRKIQQVQRHNEAKELTKQSEQRRSETETAVHSRWLGRLGRLIPFRNTHGIEPSENMLTTLSVWGEELYRRGETVAATERPNPIDPTEALEQHQRLVFLGAPGSGKSTLVQYLARQAAKQSTGVVPIVIRARDVIRDKQGRLLRQFGVEQTAAGDEDLRVALDKQIEQGQVLWLLDGVDEVGGASASILEDASRLPGQLVITSRPVGYPGGLPTLAHFEVLPLQTEDVTKFLQNWFAMLAEQLDKSADLAATQAADLQQRIEGQPRLAPLLLNPLLLTFLTMLYAVEPDLTLPASRAELYRQYVKKLLIEHWEKQRSLFRDERERPIHQLGHLTQVEAETMLWDGYVRLGWHLHRLYYAGRPDMIPTQEAVQAQLALDVKQMGQDHPANLAAGIVSFWQEAGLLDNQPVDKSTCFLTFRHFTFQEYAAALCLVNAWQADPKATWKWLKPRLHIPTWREPLLLMSSELTESKRNTLVRCLLRMRHPLRFIYPAHNLYEGTLHRNSRLAAAIISEGLPVNSSLVAKIVRRIGWLSRSHTGKQTLTLFAITLSCWGFLGLVMKLGVGLVIVDSVLSSLVLWLIIWGVILPRIPFFANILFSPARLWGNQSRTVFLQLLGQIGNVGAVSALSRSLKDSEKYICQGAAVGLGQTGNKAAVPALIKALGDSSENVRKEVARALGQVGDEAVVPTLIKCLEGGDDYVRQGAAMALGQIGDKAAVPPLIKSLENGRKEVRLEAAKALGEIGDAIAVPALVQTLSENDWSVRQRATEALKQIGDAAISTLIQRLGDSDSSVRKGAAMALGHIGNTTAVPTLIKSLEDGCEEVRREAAKALKQIENSTFAPTPTTSPEDSSKDARREAAGVLKEIVGNGEFVPALVKSLEDSSKDARVKTIKALGQIEHPSAMAILTLALGDSRWDVSNDATEMLEKNGKLAVPVLIDFLRRRHEYLGMRIGLAMKEDEANFLLALIQAIEDSRERTRQMVRILGRIGDTEAVPTLIQVLKSWNKYVRHSTAVALGQMGDPVALPGLIKSLGYKYADWRREAIETLQSPNLKISNRKLLRRLLRWLWWWLPINDNAWQVMDGMAQQLAIIEARQLPAADIPLHPTRHWRIGLGAFLAGVGLLLIGLGQDVVSNLLAEQVGMYMPAGWYGLLLLIGIALVLVGLTLFWQRWQATKLS